jgi:hypothetical protein
LHLTPSVIDGLGFVSFVLPCAVQPLPTRCVSHCGFATYIKKVSLGKRRIMETQIFHHAKIYQIFKISSKRNQNLSRYYNFVANLKFQHKQKYHLLKNPHTKINLL